MKQAPNVKVEKFRSRSGSIPSDSSYGNNGVFVIPCEKTGAILTCIVSDGGNWEHISVDAESGRRTPTWDEMDFIKSLFFEPNEVVIQYHVSDSRKVNFAEHVLHLWKPIKQIIPMPPKIFV